MFRLKFNNALRFGGHFLWHKTPLFISNNLATLALPMDRLT